MDGVRLSSREVEAGRGRRKLTGPGSVWRIMMVSQRCSLTLSQKWAKIRTLEICPVPPTESVVVAKDAS